MSRFLSCKLLNTSGQQCTNSCEQEGKSIINKICKLEVSNGRFLERKIWNPLAYVADMLKKLSGSGQLYIVNVKIVLM